MQSIDTHQAKERLRKALGLLRLPHYQADELFLAINELILCRIKDAREEDE